MTGCEVLLLRLGPPQIGALPPAAAVAVVPVSIAAHANATLDAGTGSSCYNPPCDYGFAVTCTGGVNLTRTGPSDTAIISAGEGPDYDINMTVPNGTTCSVHLELTDNNNATSEAAAAPDISTANIVRVAEQSRTCCSHH